MPSLITNALDHYQYLSNERIHGSSLDINEEKVIRFYWPRNLVRIVDLFEGTPKSPAGKLHILEMGYTINRRQTPAG